MYNVGIALGILIGAVTGLVVVLILKTGTHASKLSDIKLVIPEFLSIPTFWFGGPWLTTSLLELIELNDILDLYILSLTCTFVLVISFPAFRFIVNAGEEIGGRVALEGGSDD